MLSASAFVKDDYLGWIAATSANDLIPAKTYQAPILTAQEIQARLPKAIEFAQAAMAVPNEYLWGGTSAPNYDCSGLVQSAFMAAGIQVPRDSCQQEDFTQRISQSDLQPGDLIFFGTPERTTHVALYIGNDQYIHSSGKRQRPQRHRHRFAHGSEPLGERRISRTAALLWPSCEELSTNRTLLNLAA